MGGLQARVPGWLSQRLSGGMAERSLKFQVPVCAAEVAGEATGRVSSGLGREGYKGHLRGTHLIRSVEMGLRRKASAALRHILGISFEKKA